MYQGNVFFYSRVPRHTKNLQDLHELVLDEGRPKAHLQGAVEVESQLCLVGPCPRFLQAYD